MRRYSWHFKYGNWSSEALIFCHLSGMMFVLDSLQVRVYLSSKVQPFLPHFPSNKTINNQIISTLDDNSHSSHFLWNKKKPVQVQVTLTVIVISVKAVSLFKYCLRRFLAGLVLFMLSGISGCSRSADVYFLTIQEKGKNLPATEDGRWQQKLCTLSHKRTEVETVDWPQSLFSGCFLFHVWFLSTSTSLSWMEDIIFRQAGTKRHIC